MKRRRLFPLLAIFVAVMGATYALACNDTALVEAPDCHPDHCSCEEDPFQPLCRGFNDKPEGGGDVTFSETGPGPDAATDSSDANVPNDAESDGADDSGDAGD